MLEKIKGLIIPHIIGLVLMVGGWFISIMNVGLTRFQPDILFTKWTLSGLVMIVIGAYLPSIWSKIRGN
jgi:hypothetical protein